MMTVLRPALATSLALASFGWAADRTGVADARAANPSDRQSLVARKFQVEADRLLGQVTSTSYRHRTRVVEAAGVYETDCKGLIAFLLRKISPAHLEVLPVATGRRKPRAVEYYEFFRGQPPVGQPRRRPAGIAAASWSRRHFRSAPTPRPRPTNSLPLGRGSRWKRFRARRRTKGCARRWIRCKANC